MREKMKYKTEWKDCEAVREWLREHNFMVREHIRARQDAEDVHIVVGLHTSGESLRYEQHGQEITLWVGFQEWCAPIEEK